MTFDTCCLLHLQSACASNIAQVNWGDQNTNFEHAKWYFRLNLFIRVENCISARLIDEVCAESYCRTFLLHPTNRNSSISFLASLELRHRRNIFNARIIYIFIGESQSRCEWSACDWVVIGRKLCSRMHQPNDFNSRQDKTAMSP